MGNTDNALLVMRIGIGVLFVLAGFGKLTGIMGPGLSGFSGMVWGSMFLAGLIAVAELLGGLAVLVGFKTTWASWGLTLIILGSFFLVHLKSFDMMPFLLHVVLLTTLVGLALAGSGSHAFRAD